MVFWGAGIKAKDNNSLNKLIKKAGSVVGSELVTLEEVVEDRMLSKLLAIMDRIFFPIYLSLYLSALHRCFCFRFDLLINVNKRKYWCLHE